jgi:phage gp46-like protein
MTDFATIVVADPATGRKSLDWALDGPDLKAEDGLQTKIYISLFSDRQAAADDILPAGETDRRGWWGDTPLDGSGRKPRASELIGSRLWLLAGAKQTQIAATRAKHYALEALAWLTETGIAESVKVDTVWLGGGLLGLVVRVSQRDGTGRIAVLQFAYVWGPTMAQAADPAQIQAISSVLTTEDGVPLTTEDMRPISIDY